MPPLDIPCLYPSILDYSLLTPDHVLSVVHFFLCVYALWEMDLAAMTSTE